jgi:hypothetical protein
MVDLLSSVFWLAVISAVVILLTVATNTRGK